MPQPISLKEAEKKAFITASNDGFWDIFLGCFFLIFVIGSLPERQSGRFLEFGRVPPILGAGLHGNLADQKVRGRPAGWRGEIWSGA